MFTVEGVILWSDLEEQVRRVPLLREQTNRPVHPYENADISIKEVSIPDTRPTTLYVVRSLLFMQEQLSFDLAEQGYDPLNLQGGLIVRKDGDATSTGLIPPLVEETDVDGIYFLDGGHRTYRALHLGKLVCNALYIRGVSTDCPAYAYPNEWHEIIEYDEIPSDPSIKKRYRPNYKALYRDFSSINNTKLREPGSA